jgi:hypothetical protein
VERAANGAGGPLGVERVGVGEGVRAHLEHGPQGGAALVEGGDPLQAGLGELAGRERAALHSGPQLGDARLVDRRAGA